MGLANYLRPSFRQLLLAAFLLIAGLLAAASLGGLFTLERLMAQTRASSERAALLTGDARGCFDAPKPRSMLCTCHGQPGAQTPSCCRDDDACDAQPALGRCRPEIQAVSANGVTQMNPTLG